MCFCVNDEGMKTECCVLHGNDEMAIEPSSNERGGRMESDDEEMVRGDVSALLDESTDAEWERSRTLGRWYWLPMAALFALAIGLHWGQVGGNALGLYGVLFSALYGLHVQGRWRVLQREGKEFYRMPDVGMFFLSLFMGSCLPVFAFLVARGVTDTVSERFGRRSFVEDPVSFVFLLVVASSIMVVGFRVFSPKKPGR
jgi:hypothetical protein